MESICSSLAYGGPSPCNRLIRSPWCVDIRQTPVESRKARSSAMRGRCWCHSEFLIFISPLTHLTCRTPRRRRRRKRILSNIIIQECSATTACDRRCLERSYYANQILFQSAQRPTNNWPQATPNASNINSNQQFVPGMLLVKPTAQPLPSEATSSTTSTAVATTTIAAIFDSSHCAHLATSYLFLVLCFVFRIS